MKSQVLCETSETVRSDVPRPRRSLIMFLDAHL